MDRKLAMLCASAMALVVIGLFTAVSSAASAKLDLNVEGNPAAVGTQAEGHFLLGQGGSACVVSQAGTLESNGSATDRLSWGALLEAEQYCFEVNTYVYGTATSAKLTSAGAFELKMPKTVIEVPAPAAGVCFYKATKFEGKVAIPGSTDIELSGTGKLLKHDSALGRYSNLATCESTATLTGEAQISVTGGTFFETALAS